MAACSLAASRRRFSASRCRSSFGSGEYTSRCAYLTKPQPSQVTIGAAKSLIVKTKGGWKDSERMAVTRQGEGGRGVGRDAHWLDEGLTPSGTASPPASAQRIRDVSPRVDAFFCTLQW